MNKNDRRLINEQIKKYEDQSDYYLKKFIESGDDIYRDMSLMLKGRAESLRELLFWG